jgi:hypothetical protein
MGRSPSFGSVARHLSPFRTRVRSGSGCPCLNLATNNHSSAHSTKGTPSHPQGVLRLAGSARFQALFHSPRRGAFHRSLTVLVPYRSPAVFSLGSWSTQLPTRFRVSDGTHGQPPHAAETKSPTGLSPPPVGRSSAVRLSSCARASGRYPAPWLSYYPTQAARTRSVTPGWFGLLPFRSPLLRESSLFLGVLRCFSSPGAPPVRRPGPSVARRGLPHSETPGSPVASSSPGLFAAWPRPSSAAGA